MRSLIRVFLFIFCIGSSFAQDHLALRFNEQGILKILQMALRYNTGDSNSSSVVIPKNLYQFTIPSQNLNEHPVLNILQEMSSLDFSRDIHFYLHTSDLKVTADFDPESIKTNILNSKNNGFDLSLRFNLTHLRLTGKSLSLCEDRIELHQECGDGLKASISNLRISTANKHVKVNLILRVRTDGQVARLKVKSISSNLSEADGPALKIEFVDLSVPPISLDINGVKSEIDTTNLKKGLLSYTNYFGEKLLNFAADFAANDLVEMINMYLMHESVATSYLIYRKVEQATEIDVEELMQISVPRDGTLVHLPRDIVDVDPMSTFMRELSNLIRSAKVELSLKNFSTPKNKDVQMSGLLDFVVNGKPINFAETLGNSSRTLPELNFSSFQNSDINLALSEPLVNGVLDLASENDLFNRILNIFAPIPGFSVNSVRVHFTKENSFAVIANAQIDLKRLSSKSFSSYLKNQVAAFLERNNNNSVIYFPLEVHVKPHVVQYENDEICLSLELDSPFQQDVLRNDFNYPSNIHQMTETVKSGIIKELKASLADFVNKSYDVDIKQFVNQSGVMFSPKSIKVVEGAYLHLSLDISDIKFNATKPLQR